MAKKRKKYFAHDSDARNDPKVARLRMKMGMEGYGIYFALLEMMRESDDYTLPTDYEMLSWELHVDESTMKAVVEDYGLFELSEYGDFFYSKSFNRRMEITKARSEAGKKGMASRFGNDKEADEETQADNKSITKLPFVNNKKEEEKENFPHTPIKEKEKEYSSSSSSQACARACEEETQADNKSITKLPFVNNKKEEEKENFPHTPIKEKEKEKEYSSSSSSQACARACEEESAGEYGKPPTMEDQEHWYVSLANDQGFIEMVAMNNNLSGEQTKILITAYNAEITATKDLHPSETLYRRHALRWIGRHTEILNEKRKRNETSTANRGSDNAGSTYEERRQGVENLIRDLGNRPEPTQKVL